MILRLSVTSYHRFTSNVVESETLNALDGKLELTLGRSENCDWVLSDPEKIISSYHARIELVNNSAYIYDMSTNGVFLNRSVEPIKKGLPQLITHGDVIAIGDYEIEAAISQHKSASATDHLRNDQAIQLSRSMKHLYQRRIATCWLKMSLFAMKELTTFMTNRSRKSLSAQIR